MIEPPQSLTWKSLISFSVFELFSVFIFDLLMGPKRAFSVRWIEKNQSNKQNGF